MLSSSRPVSATIPIQSLASSTAISLPLAGSLFNGLPAAPPPPPFAWNCLVRAYANSSTPVESVRIFCGMLRAGIKGDSFSYPFVLKACGHGSLIREGRSLHSLILRTEFRPNKFVGNTLLRMYAACGDIDFARKVFDEMALRDVVSWSSMIASYVACDSPLDAFKVFRLMNRAFEKPNSVTLVSLLSGCSQTVKPRVGMSIHAHVIGNSVKLDTALGTALLEMYSKCGDIERAYKVFNSLSDKNLQCWTIMISSLAENGLGKEAAVLFAEMERSGIKPDSTSFSVILSACSHFGLVVEGRKYFDEMERVSAIKLSVEHYGCMVDLFGRAGLIEEAYEMIKEMPMEPSSIILRSFMSACTTYGQAVSLDDNMRKLVLKLEPELGSYYVLAANMSSLSCSWDVAAELRSAMKEKGIKKDVGSSWVEMNGRNFAEFG